MSKRKKETKPWDIDIDNLRGGELDSFAETLTVYTYRIVGKYILPSLEQWERQFMRNAIASSDMMAWVAICDAFEKWCNGNGKHSTDDQKKLFIRMMYVASGGDILEAMLEGCEHEHRETFEDQNLFEEAKQQFAEAMPQLAMTIERILSLKKSQTDL